MIKLNKVQVIKLLILFYGLAVFVNTARAQDRPNIPDTAKYKVVRTDKENKKSAANKAHKTVKGYSSIINKNFVTKTGLFSIHKYKDTVYFEIPDSILHRDIMVINRIGKISYGMNTYAGEEVDEKAIQFELGPDSTLIMRNNLVAAEADSGSKVFKAVQQSLANPILKSMPIVAYGKNSKSYVIDVSTWFKEKASLLTSLGNAPIELFAVLEKDFHTDVISVYPINIEISVSTTYNATAGAYKGWFNVQLHTSMVMLPKVPLMRRYADERIGFFNNTVLPFSDDQQRVKWKKFIVRWRLEPKDEDLEKWKRGELVEPQKPIIIYIDPAAPKQWHSYLIQGINDWQKAFEQAGFKNAIVGKEWPESDTTMHMDDARYSFLNYFPSLIQNAYGPHVTDPRSGEIIQTHIGWYANVMNLLHNWYQIQAGAVDPRARKPKFDDELMGELIRFVSSHEVGHTLGLAHNFGSSSRTPVDSLRNKAYVEKYGHTASIMDYARFNYVAQPEDNISEKGIFPRIGDYDKWAIEWGYKPTLAGNADEDEKIVRKWADERLTNPRLWFGDGETKALLFDPRTQTEDLGDNPVVAGTYGIKNLQRVLPKLPEWTFEDGNPNNNLSASYTELLNQYFQYINHALKYVGGYYRNNNSDVQKDAVYIAEPKKLQQDLLFFFNEQLFKTPTWLLDKTVLNKITGIYHITLPPEDLLPVVFIERIQSSIIEDLLSVKRLAQIRSNMERFGDNVYPLKSYITTLHGYLWQELKEERAIKEDSYRRNIQKRYLRAILQALQSGEQADDLENDTASILKADLYTLARELKQAALRTKDRLTLYHFKDLRFRIGSFFGDKNI